MILNIGKLSGGTRVTAESARKHSKPCLVVPLDLKPVFEEVYVWLAEHRIKVLNVAGPRKSKQPGVHQLGWLA